MHQNPVLSQTPNAVDPELLLPLLSPHEHLNDARIFLRTVLSDLGTLKSDLAGSEALSRHGEFYFGYHLDAARNTLTQLYGVVQLLLDKHAQTVADFGRVDSKAPF
jgi:hypothetical protein